MAENPPPVRFKPDMPHIPGVKEAPAAVQAPSQTPPAQLPAVPRPRNPLLPLIVGFFALALIFIFGSRWISRTHPVETARPEPAPQIEVPPPPPDPSALLPHANESNPVVASTTDLAKPWSSADFFIRSGYTNDEVPATVVRLPTGSASQASGYWAFSRKAPYGPCELEYVKDLEQLRSGYSYREATHPMVGNPCSHTLYDPLKTASLPGNIWIRGAIAQGSDIRPPFGVEIKIRGKQILAVRSE
jgi:hypothetical protein